MSIAENLKDVRQRILKAEQAQNRDANSTELIAVSKTFDAAAIRPLLEAGQKVFGETACRRRRESGRS